MDRTISLDNKDLQMLRTVDPRLMSYNIEMTEVTGGTFWKAYTPEQIAGKEKFPQITAFGGDFTAIAGLMQYYPPIDLYNKKLRAYASELGSVWIRVSGSWATQTYYDFDAETDGNPPKGYKAVLTREQWVGVLDFVKAVGGKLLISVSNCEGDHPDGGELDLSQTKKIFNFSHEYGVNIDAAEFMNEPNMMEVSGSPKGYTASDYARDQDIFNSWVKEHYPNCLLVGPCTTGDPTLSKPGEKGIGGGIGSLMTVATTDALMNGTKIPLNVFSYHYYNGVSERLEMVAPHAHWDGSAANTDEYLAVAPNCAERHTPLRDKYVPGGQMWVTESGDAGGGGNTWASTYLDVFRTLNELGGFAQVTDGVIFHNTLASSDYGFLEHGTFDPRPNYFAVLLWNKLMGETVYATEQSKENLHIYCHSRKDGKKGCVYLVINNSLTDTVSVELSKEAEVYCLSADTVRSTTMKLNGKDLDADASMQPVLNNTGKLTLAPTTCTFVIV